MGVAGCHDPVDSRCIRNRNLKNPHHLHNAGQTDVGHRRLIAMTKHACLRLGGQTLLEGGQAGPKLLDLPLVRLVCGTREAEPVDEKGLSAMLADMFSRRRQR